jgi:hypothetical protein
MFSINNGTTIKIEFTNEVCHKYTHERKKIGTDSSAISAKVVQIQEVFQQSQHFL